MSVNDRLVRLPDGTWVRPSWVNSVEASDAEEHTTGPFPACVRVYTRGGRAIRLECANNTAARELRDQIGRTLADAEDADNGGEGEEHS